MRLTLATTPTGYEDAALEQVVRYRRAVALLDCATRIADAEVRELVIDRLGDIIASTAVEVERRHVVAERVLDARIPAFGQLVPLRRCLTCGRAERATRKISPCGPGPE